MSKNIASSIVIGLGYGDEAKGMTVAKLSERIANNGEKPLVVRWNGGPQAAHNVRLGGKHHTFSQFGSGTLSGARTLLSDGMLVSPFALMKEADALIRIGVKNPLGSMLIDRNAPLLLPTHRVINQELELRRGDKRHGSTGIGVGVARTFENEMKEAGAQARIPIADDIANPFVLAEKIQWMQEWLQNHYNVEVIEPRIMIERAATQLHLVYADMTAAGAKFTSTDNILWDERHNAGNIIFEGAQGVMLDKNYGHFPYVTYGDMIPDGIIRGCITVDMPKPRIIGCTRTYSTRHGAGPFYSEGTADISETDNGTGKWQGVFRTGLLDLEVLRYTSGLVHPDALSVSCLDKYPGKVITGYTDDSGKPVDGITIPEYGFKPSSIVSCKPVISEASESAMIELVKRACNADVMIEGRGESIEEWSFSD